MLKVKWLYRKQDVVAMAQQKLAIPQEDLQYVGENEVFPTNHVDRVFADGIQSKCLVYPIAEYDQLSITDITTTFFTRAVFDVNKLTLTPGFAQWEQYCVCKKPLNPNLLYVRCDECHQWFHLSCMNLTKEQAEELEKFSCGQCKPSSQI